MADTITVLELKKEIAKLVDVPVYRQNILVTGRVLADEKTLNTYPTIKDGTKLQVIIKKTEPLDAVMQKLLKRFFSQEHSETLTENLMADFQKRLDQLSLDDIEKLAKYFLDRDRQLYGET